MSRVIDIVGNRYGRLLVLSFSSSSKSGSKWLCLCDCGVEKVVAGASMKNGAITSRNF